MSFTSKAVASGLLGGQGGGAVSNPTEVLGAKLECWFDFSNTANQTLNSGDVSQQISEEGDYKAINATPGEQPPYNASIGMIEPDGSADSLFVQTHPGGAAPSTIFGLEQGLVMIIGRGDGNGISAVLTAADQNTTNHYQFFGLRMADAQSNKFRWQTQVAAAGDVLDSTTATPDTPNTSYVLGYTNGTTVRQWVNGAEQTVIETTGSNNGGFFNDAHTGSNRLDSLFIARLRRTVNSYYSGAIKHIVIAAGTVTDEEISSLNTWGASQ